MKAALVLAFLLAAAPPSPGPTGPPDRAPLASSQPGQGVLREPHHPVPGGRGIQGGARPGPGLRPRAAQLRPRPAQGRQDRRGGRRAAEGAEAGPLHPAHLVQPRHRPTSAISDYDKAIAQFERMVGAGAGRAGLPLQPGRRSTSSPTSRTCRSREFETAARARPRPRRPPLPALQRLQDGRPRRRTPRASWRPSRRSRSARRAPPSPRTWSGAGTPSSTTSPRRGRRSGPPPCPRSWPTRELIPGQAAGIDPATAVAHRPRRRRRRQARPPRLASASGRAPLPGRHDPRRRDRPRRSSRASTAVVPRRLRQRRPARSLRAWPAAPRRLYRNAGAGASRGRRSSSRRAASARPSGSTSITTTTSISCCSATASALLRNNGRRAGFERRDGPLSLRRRQGARRRAPARPSPTRRGSISPSPTPTVPG